MWEIYTFGGGDSLQILFSAIVALTDTNDFMALVRLLLIATGLFVAIEVAFTARLQPMPRVLVFVFLFFVGFVLDADIQIIDRVDPTASSTVADVPVGIAVPASFISTIGDWATRSFETFFSLPNDIKYSENGMLMASRLLESTNQWYPADSRFASNLQNFMADCVQYGTLVGWFQWDEILKSEDLWRDIGIWGLGSGIFTQYTPVGGAPSMQSCDLAYTNIDGEWNTATDDTIDVYAQKFFSKQSASDASTRLKASLPVSWSFLAGVSASASELVQQQVVLNIFQRSASSLAAQSNATGAMQDYALAVGQVQQRTTYQTLGALAGRTIILIHNIFEVIVYGIFPLVLLMVMVSLKQGQNFLMYIKSILWLQLWAPLFALLNFVTTFYATGTTTAAANYIDASTLTNGLNLLTMMDISSANGDISAMAGYLAWMIPILAWSIVSASGSAGAHLATGLGAVGQSAGSQAASEASRGNISMGQLSLDNHRAGQVMMAPSMSSGHGLMTGSDGIANTLTGGPGGGIIQNVPQNSFGVSAQAIDAVKQGMATRLTNETAKMNQALASAGHEMTALLNEMRGQSQATATSASVNNMGQIGSNTKTSTNSNSISTFTNEVGSNSGFSVSDSTAILGVASAIFSSGIKNVPGASILRKLGKIDVGIEGAIKGKTDAQLNDAWNAAMKVASSDDFRNSLGMDTSAGVSIVGMTGHNTSDATSTGIEATLGRAQKAIQMATEQVREGQQWQQAINHAEEKGLSVGGDLTAAVYNSLEGQPKTGAAIGYGSSSPNWMSGDINQLKQQAAQGDPQAVGIFMEAAAAYGAADGLKLAGIDGPPAKPQYEVPTMNDGQIVDTHNDNISTVGGGSISPTQVKSGANSVIDIAGDQLNAADAELGNREQENVQNSSTVQNEVSKKLESSPAREAFSNLFNRVNPFD